MRTVLLFLGLLLPAAAPAAAKSHIVAFGKAQAVKWYVGLDETKPLDLKIRPLYVDTRLKEYTIGSSHEVTDRLFVVRRAFRLNDTLPDESTAPRWQWQRGGWLLVDRLTGRVSPINLPDFDPFYSAANWYRDYIAYCGVADDGKKLYAVVVQLGRRKPVLKRLMGEAAANELPDSECSAPAWQRRPARVTFTPQQGDKLTFSIHGHVVDLVSNDDGEDQDSE